MNKKSLLFVIIVCSDFAVAMNEGEGQCAKKGDVTKVDLTQLNSLDLNQLNKPLKESPSMPSPKQTVSPAHSPRLIDRFLSQNTLATHATEKAGEGLNRAFQRLKECDARLQELQGATEHDQKDIRGITNVVRALADRVLDLERSHDDRKKLITEASGALREAMILFQVASPAIKRVPSQPLRSSPNRGVSFSKSVAAPAVSILSSVATSSTAEDRKRAQTDEKSCSSESDSDSDADDAPENRTN